MTDLNAAIKDHLGDLSLQSLTIDRSGLLQAKIISTDSTEVYLDLDLDFTSQTDVQEALTQAIIAVLPSIAAGLADAMHADNERLAKMTLAFLKRTPPAQA